jgi:hypothetical protein
MADRNLGETGFSWWVGTVVDVMDPHQSGRVKVRVRGRHDDTTNIPDENLPWAMPVQPTTSAAVGRMGTAPVGLVKGSRVIGFWADEDMQYPMVTGSLGKSGDAVDNQYEGGAPKIDTSVGSITSGAQGSATNYRSALNSSAASISTYDTNGAPDSIKNTDGVTITKEVERGMRFAKNPTIGSVSPNNNCTIQKMLRQVDPLGINSSLKCLPSGLNLLTAILDVAGSLAKSIIDKMANAIRSALINLMRKLGIQNILTQLNALTQQMGNVSSLLNQLIQQSCGINPLTLGAFRTIDLAFATALNTINSITNFIALAPSAIANMAAGTVDTLLTNAIVYPLASVATSLTTPPPYSTDTPPPSYVQQYYADGSDPYPGYIVWVDPNGVGQPAYTPRNGQPNFTSSAQHTTYVIENAISRPLENAINTGKLDSSTFSTILSDAETIGKQLALSTILGVGFNIAGGLLSSAVNVPLIASSLQQDQFLIASVGTIVPEAEAAVAKFVSLQAIAVKKAVTTRIMVSNTPVLPGSCSI